MKYCTLICLNLTKWHICNCKLGQKCFCLPASTVSKTSIRACIQAEDVSFVVSPLQRVIVLMREVTAGPDVLYTGRRGCKCLLLLFVTWVWNMLEIHITFYSNPQCLGDQVLSQLIFVTEHLVCWERPYCVYHRGVRNTQRVRWPCKANVYVLSH